MIPFPLLVVVVVVVVVIVVVDCCIGDPPPLPLECYRSSFSSHNEKFANDWPVQRFVNWSRHRRRKLSRQRPK